MVCNRTRQYTNTYAYMNNDADTCDIMQAMYQNGDTHNRNTVYFQKMGQYLKDFPLR